MVQCIYLHTILYISHIYMYLVGVMIHTHFKALVRIIIIHFTIYITVGSFLDGCFFNSLLHIKLESSLKVYTSFFLMKIYRK